MNNYFSLIYFMRSFPWGDIKRISTFRFVSYERERSNLSTLEIGLHLATRLYALTVHMIKQFLFRCNTKNRAFLSS